ncbi:histidine kinase [Rhodoferax sp.]|uniref:sensor histidine kinase n=1 Tax=Rhodoferax sp. TaxID=50421 RepID=UPI00260006EC|nr:histidine kinase [Rhodoferax sp.]MCM2341278.1 histidine kinase [Rhodoferax sp.]
MTSYRKLALPDFRNLGVILRVTLLAEALRLVMTVVIAPDLAAAFAQYTAQGLLYEPVLLISLALLYALAPWLQRVSYGSGVAFILALVVVVVLALQLGLRAVLPGELPESVWRSALLAVVVSATLLAYLNWRHLRLSPSLAESRLMALQARIRPHFLFNTLNSVLGLIREDPKRAETMLENLADLFRAVMADSRALVPFSQELELAKAYVAIEEIRFGARLRVNWSCDAAPADALVPPLLLQPLVENAVLHGVAPLEAGAQISVEAYEDDRNLMVLVRNPISEDALIHEGNRIALDNIRERLALHFDVEARLKVETVNGEFVVSVRIPIKHGRAA